MANLGEDFDPTLTQSTHLSAASCAEGLMMTIMMTIMKMAATRPLYGAAQCLRDGSGYRRAC